MIALLERLEIAELTAVHPAFLKTKSFLLIRDFDAAIFEGPTTSYILKRVDPKLYYLSESTKFVCWFQMRQY